MRFFAPKTVYLDYASGALIQKDAVLGVSKLLGQKYANPASIHTYGILAKKIIDSSRSSIASCIQSHTDEIIFTGSGTESIALSLMGSVYEAIKNNIKKPHIVTSTIEHSAVLETCALLTQRDLVDVTYLNPNEHGLISPLDVSNSLRDDTVIVSIHMVNSEIGVIQNIDEYIKVINSYKQKKYKIPNMRLTSRSFYPYLHVDACQAYAHLNLSNIVKRGIDMISFNSVKVGGIAGIGALYKKRSIVLGKIYAGGSQEQGLHPGTVSPVLTEGFKMASVINNKNREANENKYKNYKQDLLNQLNIFKKDTGIDFVENSSIYSVPSIINISFPNMSGQQMAIELNARGVIVSSKSACNSEKDTESYVIDALRKNNPNNTYKNYGSIRISFGPETNKKHINKLIQALYDIARTYRGVIY